RKRHRFDGLRAGCRRTGREYTASPCTGIQYQGNCEFSERRAYPVGFIRLRIAKRSSRGLQPGADGFGCHDLPSKESALFDLPVKKDMSGAGVGGSGKTSRIEKPEEHSPLPAGRDRCSEKRKGFTGPPTVQRIIGWAVGISECTCSQ